MKKLVYEQIDKNIIIYAKNPVRVNDLIITPRILSYQIIHPDEFSILKHDSVIQVIVAPTIHELLDLKLKEILKSLLDWGEKFNFGKIKIFFRIPKNHPLLMEQITVVKTLIDELNDFMKDEFASRKMHYQIRLFLENEITFGKDSNSTKLTCSFKNGTFEIIKHVADKYHRFRYDNNHDLKL